MTRSLLESDRSRYEESKNPKSAMTSCNDEFRPMRGENMQGKYPVITLCGSTRFKEQFMEAQKEETEERKREDQQRIQRWIWS